MRANRVFDSALRPARKPRLPAVALLAALLSLALPASADDGAAALFDEGLESMLAGRYEVGCPKIAESFRLEPLPGTLFTLAECESKRGRIATAVQHYESYLALYTALPPEKQAKQRGREKIAAEQKAALEPQVPLLTLELAKGAPIGTVVRRDGEVLSATSLGLQIPVDPGEHVVTAQAPKGRLVELRVKLSKGERKTLVIEKYLLETDPRRTAAFIAGGAGIAGVVAGAITGGLALGEKRAIDDNCVDVDERSATCNGVGKAAADRAKAFAAASTTAFGVGLVGLATGVVLYLVSAPPAGKPITTNDPPKRGAEIRWRLAVTGSPAERGAVMLGAEGTW